MALLYQGPAQVHRLHPHNPQPGTALTMSVQVLKDTDSDPGHTAHERLSSSGPSALSAPSPPPRAAHHLLAGFRALHCPS